MKAADNGNQARNDGPAGIKPAGAVVFPAGRVAEAANLKQRDEFTVKAKVRPAGDGVVFDVLP